MTLAKHMPFRVGLMALGLLLTAGAAGAAVSTDRPSRSRALVPVPAPQISASFDPAARETRVTGEAEGACVALALPLAWSLEAGEGPAGSARLQADRDGPELDLMLRAARTLPPVPTLASRGGVLPAEAQDLPRRAAAALQREHEGALGRQAQSAALTPLAPGVLRLTATWMDPSLPGGSMTLDSVILALSPDWVLDMTLTGAGSAEIHEALLAEVLGSARVGEACR